MVDPFWASVAAAGLGGIGAGVLLQLNQERLRTRRSEKAYLKLRGALVEDLTHNISIVDQIWMDAKEPYHTVQEGNTRETRLQGEPVKIMGGKPLPLRLETWDLAKGHLLPMAQDPRDGLRFSRAFQLFVEAASPQLLGSPKLELLNRIVYRTPDSIFQPTVLTCEGHQLRGVPESVMRVFTEPAQRRKVLELILEYGTLDQVDTGQEIAGHAWQGAGSWRSVGGEPVFISKEYYPEEDEQR